MSKSRETMYDTNIISSKTPASELNTMMIQRGITPIYELQPNITGEGKFTIKVTCGNLTSVGVGHSKKAAKQSAADIMLRRIIQYQIDDPDGLSEWLGKDTKTMNDNDNSKKQSPSSAAPDSNSTQTLMVLCRQYRLLSPKFHLVTNAGPPHAPHFKVRCTVSNLTEEGYASTKKMAKREAVVNMINKIKYLCKTNSLEGISNIAHDDRVDDVTDSEFELGNLKYGDDFCDFPSTNRNHEKANAHHQKNIPPEIEKQLIIVLQEIRKLLSMI